MARTLSQAFDREGAMAVEEFVRKWTKPYLGAFVRANGINITSRARKETIAAELSKHLGWRKTLLGLTS